jgi:hypothetical protein
MAKARSYPSRPVRLLVGYPPGLNDHLLPEPDR